LSVQRRYRLRQPERFRQVRSAGKSWASPLLVLCALPNGLDHNRFGFSVSRRLGGAVRRNLVRRRLREIIRLQRTDMEPGWDVVIIARPLAAQADFLTLKAACMALLKRAQLLGS